MSASVVQTSHYFYYFGPFRLGTRERFLLRQGMIVPLSPKAFDTLALLVAHNGQLLEKDRLLTHLWPETEVEENNLVQVISALRKALGQRRCEHQYIETVTGRGYRFVARVQTLPDEGRESYFRNGVHSARTATAPGTPARPAIAVLPFRVVGAGASEDYLKLGMADALITRLSNLSQLIVRPTSAVLKHTSLAQDPAAAGRALGVDYVLEGMIQLHEQRIRVTVQLVRKADGVALWAAKFDERFTSIFVVQDSISEQVARALMVRLSGEDWQRLTRHHTSDAEAFQLYLKGRYFWNKRTAEGLTKGIAYFEQALELDANYALAYAGLADSWNVLGKYSHLPPQQVFPKAKTAALKALAIDDTLAEAHTSLADVRLFYDWDIAGAESAYQRAIDLNPNYVTAHHWYSRYLQAAGSFEHSLAEARRARELDPLSVVINTIAGLSFYFARQYDQALDQFRKVVEMDANFPSAHRCLGLVYLQQARYEEAVAGLRQAVALAGDSPLMIATLGCMRAIRGQPAEARQALAELRELSNQRYVSPYHFALIHADLGERTQAFEWFERAFEDRASNFIWAGTDPMLDGLRADDEFQNLIRRVCASV